MSLDIEADRLEYWEPGFTVFLIQWDDGEGDQGCWREGEPFDALHAALGRHESLCGANFGYDQHGLKAAGIVDLFEGTWRCYDVQTLARVVVPGRFEYTLEGLGRDLLGADAVQEQGALKAAAQAHKLRWTKKDKDYYGLWKLEPELMVRYGMEDVALTIALWNLLWARATPADCEVFMMEATQVAPLLRAAEHEGVLVDQERLAALKRHLLATRDELRCQLLAQGLSEDALGTAATEDEAAGKRSDAALLADLLRIGIPLYRKTPKSGEISEKTGKRTPDKLTVNKDALKEFELRFPVVKDLIAWRSCNQILSTFVAAMEKADPRIHTSFRQAEARTSRMSSAQPNLQNLPRPDEDAADADNEMALGIRRVIVPAPGNALLVADYSGIEVMVMAHYIADPGLTAALEAGKDLYALNASLVYGLPYDDCTKAGTTQGKAYRQRSKTTVLTCMFGGGAQLLSTRLGCSTMEAAEIKRETLGAIPGYWAFDTRVKNRARSRAQCHVVTILGRRLSVPRDKLYVALNTIVQGAAAEIMKLGLIAGAAALKPHGYRPLLVVHDECVAEGPADTATEALADLVPAMESVYPLRPRLRVEADWSTDSYAACK